MCILGISGEPIKALALGSGCNSQQCVVVSLLCCLHCALLLPILVFDFSSTGLGEATCQKVPR